jgi:hypothetical protein
MELRELKIKASGSVTETETQAIQVLDYARDGGAGRNQNRVLIKTGVIIAAWTVSPTRETWDPTPWSKRTSNSEPFGRTVARKGATQTSAATNTSSFTMAGTGTGNLSILGKTRAHPQKANEDKVAQRKAINPGQSGELRPAASSDRFFIIVRTLPK